MHDHFTSVPSEGLESFIRFADRSDWELQHRGRFPVYRLTSSEYVSDGMGVRQTIRFFSALVRREDLDQIEIEEPDRQWKQEFRSEGWRTGWSLPKRKALVTVHEQLPPRVTSEFINQFWLEQDDGDLVDAVTGETVVKKTGC